MLSAPLGEAADAAPADDRLRPLSRVRAGLTEISGQPLVLVRERVPASAFPETPAASDVSTAVPPAPVSRAAMRPASAVIPSLLVVLPAAARELPAVARELPPSDNGPSYEPPVLCYPGLCYLAIPAYAPPAKPAPALPADKAPQPVAPPVRQPPAERARHGRRRASRDTPNPSLGEVPSTPAARAPALRRGADRG